MAILNGQGLFVSALAGLTNTYSTFAQQNKNGGISLEDLSNPSDAVKAQLGTNNNFLQYLTTNFSNIDSNKDGKIDAADISKLSQTIQNKGLTYNEIVQLCASGNSGMSSTLTDTVLTYFNQIDKNHDGRVTSQEITQFSMDSDREKMETEFNSFKPSSMSVFYSDDTTANDKPTSVLDSLYPQDKSNS